MAANEANSSLEKDVFPRKSLGTILAYRILSPVPSDVSTEYSSPSILRFSKSMMEARSAASGSAR